MVPRIQCHHLLRLAQRQATGSFRHVQARTPIVATQHFRPRPFSTSPTRRQEPRQAPVPEPPSAATAPPEPADPAPTTPSPPTPPTDPSPTQKDTPKKTKPRLAPRLILAIAFTLVGLSAGSSLRMLLSPPDPPTPHTEHDAYTIQVLHDQASKLPIVQQLTSDPSLWESWDAYETLSPEHRAQHISAGALAGSRGVGGFQRIFLNKLTGEVVSVIFFGAATTGWPGVVHGGCLATILDESCGRAAFKEWGGKPGLTASLGLEYKRVTLAHGFYVIRTRVRGEEELPEEERGKRHYKCWVDASVEDAVTGAVTVVAQALFVGGHGKGKKGSGSGLGGEKGQEAHVKF